MSDLHDLSLKGVIAQINAEHDAKIATLAAESEQLRKERDGALSVVETCEDSIARLERKVQFWQDRAEASAAVKVDRQALNLAISKWATDSDLHITIGDVEALHIAILSALTTQPAAPQEDEAVGYIYPDAFGRLQRGDSPRETIHATTSWPGSIALFASPPAQAVTEAQKRAIIDVFEIEWKIKNSDPLSALHSALTAAQEVERCA
jgi:hypothetical protein